MIICSSFLFLSSMSNIVFETVTNLPSTDSFWMFSFLGCFNFSLPFDFGPLSIHVSSSSVAVPCFPVISDVCCQQAHCSTKFCLNVLCYIFHNFHLLSEPFSSITCLSSSLSFFICVFHRSFTILLLLLLFTFELSFF